MFWEKKTPPPLSKAAEALIKLIKVSKVNDWTPNSTGNRLIHKPTGIHLWINISSRYDIMEPVFIQFKEYERVKIDEAFEQSVFDHIARFIEERGNTTA